MWQKKYRDQKVYIEECSIKVRELVKSLINSFSVQFSF